MKRYGMICLLCLAFCLLAACGAEKQPAAQTTAAPAETTMKIVNPLEEVPDAAAFAERLGFPLEAPGNAKDPIFHVLSGKAAQIDFLVGEAEYMLRAQKAAAGIDNLSGLHGEAKVTKQLDGGAVLETVDLGGRTALRLSWTDGDLQKVLVTDSGDATALQAVYESIK